MTERARVAVVTGASSGIGREAAKALAAQGWQVIGIGRDPARSAAAEAEIAAAATGAAAAFIRADLSLIAEAERAAAAVAALSSRVDVLINNAGGMAREPQRTAEGMEANFTGNHLGPFVLTEALLPLLRRAATDAPPGSVRIVNTSSNASEMMPDLNWDDLQLGDKWSVGASYCGTKLANVMHARGLARRLAADGIVAVSMHPGVIDSNFASHANEETQVRLAGLDKLSPAQGAEALVWLATADEPGRASGTYYHGREPHPGNPVADDPEKVERLWSESERLAAPLRKAPAPV